MGTRRVKVLQAEKAEPKTAKKERVKARAEKKEPKVKAKAEEVASAKKEVRKPERIKKAPHGKKYIKHLSFVEKSKYYPLREAIALVKKTSYTKFDAAVEAHFRLGIKPKEQKVRTTANLPHGTRVDLKSEANASLLHTILGRVSFKEEHLLENFRTILTAIKNARPAKVKGTYIRSATLSATMGPGIKIDLSSF